METEYASEASRRIFDSGCGNGLGTNQLHAAVKFVAADLIVVPELVNGVAYEPELAATGWLSSGRAVLLCEAGSVAIRVDTRAGDYADRSEVKCEMKFVPLEPGPWSIVRTSEGVAVGSPHDISSKAVSWHFGFRGKDIVEQMTDGGFEQVATRGPDGTAVEFATRLGWT